ncbi:polyketide cyclase / dehydrase and lipid transport family protein [Mycobacteriaceae bacterium 1482268.1]|nr:polyketide cyclase / dehydrase and lipid transport family protein [Mycobacteriaceae bacterium 1482268.1]
MQRYESSFVVEATPAEIWLLWFPPWPPNLPRGELHVLEMDDVRIEIAHPGDAVHEGLVRHCYYAVPKYLLSNGKAESWELVTDVVPQVSYRYRAVTRPPFAFAEGRQALEDLGNGYTRVHFSESYSVSNPILRVLLERRLHAFISRDNDTVIKAAVERGLAMLRAAADGAGKEFPPEGQAG